MEQGWHSGKSAHLPPVWPVFYRIPAWCHMWVEFAVGCHLGPSVFLQVLLFSSLHKKPTSPNSSSARIEGHLNCCCIKILTGLRCVIFICFFLIGFDQKQVCADTGLRKYSCSYWRARTTEQIHRRKAQQSVQCTYTKVKRQCCMFLSQIINTLICLFTDLCGRRGGLMVSALISGSSGPGSSPGRGHCVVFLGKTLYSHSASLHPGV